MPYIKPESARGFTCNIMRSNFFLFLVLIVAVLQVNCLPYTYPELSNSVWSDFKLFDGGSTLALGALHSTSETLPQTNPGSDGLADMLTNHKDLYGVHLSIYGDRWLAIVNETSHGLSSIYMLEAESENKKIFLDDSDVYYRHNTTLGLHNMVESKLFKSPSWNNTHFELNSSFWYPKDRLVSLAFCLPIGAMLNSAEPGGVKTMEEGRVGQNQLAYDQMHPKRQLANFSKASSNPQKYVSPTWVWVVLPITITILLVMIVMNIYCWQIKKARDRDQERQDGDRDQEGEPSLEHEIEISMIGPKRYQFSELKSATSNFNARNEIGRGGFGIVYKGTLGGEAVAVKRTSRNDQQGRKNMIAEVTTIGSLHHKNLVKLFGWCYEGNELLLIYEYMPNGSLDNLLFPEDVRNQATLSWERRYNIVCGVAQAIDYLHNECSRRVLHRDIKASNIMLDSDFNACLGDFGLARMFKLSEKTHHTSQEIAGTRAYMAPEIFFTGKATTQSDVYAFGVLAIEVACGRKPGIRNVNGEELGYSIVDWVWELYKSGMIYSVVDQKLNESYDREQVECVLLIGLACCHPDPWMRPSMRSALQVLKGQMEVPLLPTRSRLLCGQALLLHLWSW